ncbi:NAD(P)-dependent oxidoreductase [Aquipuribacter hungaricus]|uniref:NAD(P)-dependent oxidoreductase n=1 Tax=Aquipuribacter hungaricus TaxID=545624 RepID=A0ABV7WFN5_9MICO
MARQAPPTPDRPRILLTRPDVAGSEHLDRAAARLGADVVRLPVAAGAAEPDPSALRAAVVDADAVLAQPGDVLDAGVLRGAPRLRVVAVAGVGVDRVDLDVARELGVRVTNTPGVLAETVADTAMALVLMARRRLVEATDTMRDGRWTGADPTAFLGHDVAGARLGILGYGEIGRAVARRGQGFGMQVRHLERPSAPADGVSSPLGLEELLRGSDVVVLALPLTPQTRGVLDAAALDLLPPGATVVNVGRGPLVVEADLLAALRSGRLHSAGLDVFDGEPRSDPDDAVMRTPGLVVLPHVGSASVATRAAMTRAAVANIEAVVRGDEPPAPADR